jgi:hypothetical protein
MPRAKKEPARCKARTESTGKRCRKRARPEPDQSGYCNQHWHLHQTGVTAPRKHGIYVKYLSAEEQLWIPELDTAAPLDMEIRMAQVFALRAMRLFQEWNGENPNPDDGMLIVGTTQETGSRETLNPTGSVLSLAVRKAEVQRKRPDLWEIIGRFLALIGRLMHQQASIRAITAELGEGQIDAQEKAKEIRDTLALMEVKMGGNGVHEPSRRQVSGNGKKGNGHV